MSLPKMLVTYTTGEVAEWLKVSPRTVNRLVKRGVVSPMRLGSHANAPARFTEADLHAIEAALRPTARPKRPLHKRSAA